MTDLRKRAREIADELWDDSASAVDITAALLQFADEQVAEQRRRDAEIAAAIYMSAKEI